MKKILTNSFKALLLVPVLALGIATVAPQVTTHAAPENCGGVESGITGGAGCAQGNGQSATLFGNGGIFTTITNVMLYVIGAISVIMLIIGGIRYTVSGGDQTAVTAAKNTILYAIVGIIVALLSYALVNFVLTSFAGSST